MRDKHSIHTTLSTEAMRILERYEKELGSKNTVLEKVLQFVNKFCQHHNLKTFKEVDEFIKKYGFSIGQNLEIDVKDIEINISSINYEICKANGDKKGHKIGTLSIRKGEDRSIIIEQKDLNEGSVNEVSSSLFPNIYHIMSGIVN